MPDKKTPLEQALDLLVYAPLGLVITATEEMPKLVEKGRQRVSGQVTMAKMVGQFAVQQGQREAEKVVRQASTRLGELGLVPGAGGGSTEEPRAASTSTSTEPLAGAASGGPSAAAPSPAPVIAPAPPPAPAESTNGGGVPPVDQLAIPGYDSLSASQVVQRLAGLSDEELAAVAKYETATRHRKTILTRVAQLQSA